MKLIKILILLVVTVFSFVSCAQNNQAIEKSILDINQNIIGLQKAMAQLQLNVQNLEKQIKVNENNIEVNSQAIARLKDELNSYENKLSMLTKKSALIKPSVKAETKKKLDSNKTEDSEIIVIEDDSADKNSLYSYAYELYMKGKFFESLNKFTEFLKKYPNDDLSDNAMYWIGEIYYSQRNYDKCIDTMKELIKKYPLGNKVPDAMLKMGYAYLEIGDNDNAFRVLQEIIDNYPSTRAANLAKGKLKELGVLNE